MCNFETSREKKQRKYFKTLRQTVISWIDSNSTENKSKTDMWDHIKLKGSCSTKTSGNSPVNERRCLPTIQCMEVYI